MAYVTKLEYKFFKRKNIGIIGCGRLGTPEHVQAHNYIPYGGVYFHNWYCKTGPAGLFFEKSTHAFDWINRLVGVKPREIFAMTSQRIFGGDKAILFDFVKLMNGTNDTACTMEAGFVSTLMCMAARDSIETKSFVPVIWGDGRRI